MSVTYWAKRGNKRLGPFAEHLEALEAFRIAYPKQDTRNNYICVGYGLEGPWFDIHFHPAIKREG